MSYTKPQVGVGAFVVHNESLLLIRRAKPPEAEHWCIPGGKVEPGEAIEAAAVRELFEEVGLQARALHLLDVTQQLVPDQNQHWLAPSIYCQLEEGNENLPELKPAADEAKEAAWFPLDALPHPLTGTTEAALKAYHRRLKGDTTVISSYMEVSPI